MPMLLAAETFQAVHDMCPCIMAICINFQEWTAEPFFIHMVNLGYRPTGPRVLEARNVICEQRPDLTQFDGLEELTLHNLSED